MDWSNLTSGPGGPTVSDTRTIHAGVSGSVNPKYAFDVYVYIQIVFFSVLFFKTRFLTKL